jgi:hypothetical protein
MKTIALNNWAFCAGLLGGFRHFDKVRLWGRLFGAEKVFQCAKVEYHSRTTTTKMEEKSSTTFSFSLSPDFFNFLTEKFSPFLYGKFQKKEQNTFIFLFLRGFSQFSQKKKKKLHHSSHIRLIRRPIYNKGWNLCS